MNVKIQILVENTTPMPGLTGEYGFSALIEVENRKYLFDTGSAGAIFDNARFLKTELVDLDTLIISHGHFDHTGAVVSLADRNPGLRIVGHPHLFGKRFIAFGSKRLDSIGASFSAESLEQAGASFVPAPGFTAIGEGIFVTGTIPRASGFEDTGGDFRKEMDGVLIEDAIEDEMALVIDHPQGLIIVSGCAHAGIINTLTYALEQTGRNNVQMFVGGTHLMNAGPERINKTISALEKINFDRLAVGHCTGFNAAVRLKEVFGDRIVKVETGHVFRFQ